MKDINEVIRADGWSDSPLHPTAPAPALACAFSQQELAEMIPDRVDTSGRLAGLGIRSLMICGTNDARFEGMRRFAATDEGCTFVSVPDADHLQAWSRSDQPASEVRCFLHAATT